MLNALLEEHQELEKILENDNTLTDEERRDIKKKKLKLKDSIANSRSKYESKYDYDQPGGGIEYCGYNGA